MNGKLEPTNSPYAMAKLSAIELGKAISIEYGHSIINLMPTNLYGPNDNFHPDNSHVLPALLRKFHEAKQAICSVVNVWGTGKAKRELVFVDDIADAVLHFMKKKTKENWIKRNKIKASYRSSWLHFQN